MSTAGVLIIGGGQAGAQLCDALHRARYRGPVTLICGEALAPYQRPPLSKEFLAGKCDADWLAYRPRDFYARTGAEVLLGRRALHIDRAQRTVTLDDGSRRSYEHLVLATGASPRRLVIPGADSERVCYLRSLDDAVHIRARLPTARRVVVIGAGFIGLEVAAVLVAQGRSTTVIETQARVLSRVAGPVLAAYAYQIHRRHGVHIETDASVMRIDHGAGAANVVCGDGREFPADLVIAGIGVTPDLQLAQAAGLAIDNGVAVDEYCRTSDPRIFAIGDCASHVDARLGRRVRLETVHNAVEQARAVARTLTGAPTAYEQTPWVWSDQYDARIQMVGRHDDADQTIVRGDPARGAFSIFYFARGQLVGMNGVNRPHEFAASRRILNAQLPLTPVQAANPTFDLTRYAPLRKRLEFDRPWSTTPNASLAQTGAP